MNWRLAGPATNHKEEGNNQLHGTGRQLCLDDIIARLDLGSTGLVLVTQESTGLDWKHACAPVRVRCAHKSRHWRRPGCYCTELVGVHCETCCVNGWPALGLFYVDFCTGKTRCLVLLSLVCTWLTTCLQASNAAPLHRAAASCPRRSEACLVGWLAVAAGPGIPKPPAAARRIRRSASAFRALAAAEAQRLGAVQAPGDGLPEVRLLSSQPRGLPLKTAWVLLVR